MLCVTYSNGVINYAIAIRLFRTVLRDRLKNFWRNNNGQHSDML